MLAGERVGLEWEDLCSVLALLLSDLGPTRCLPDSSAPAWQGGLYVRRPCGGGEGLLLPVSQVPEGSWVSEAGLPGGLRLD